MFSFVAHFLILTLNAHFESQVWVFPVRVIGLGFDPQSSSFKGAWDCEFAEQRKGEQVRKCEERERGKVSKK